MVSLGDNVEYQPDLDQVLGPVEIIMPPRNEFAELEAALPINEHALEECSRKHPEILYAVAKKLALAISRRDAAKKELKELCADTNMEFRRAADRESEKITEKALDTMVEAEADVREKVRQVGALDEQVGLLFALKEAFQSRGNMIEVLVRLYLGNYYSESSVDRAARPLREEAATVNRRELSRRRVRLDD